MKKIIYSLLTILVIIISGCSNQKTTEYHYTYKGENELWSVEYKVDGSTILTTKKEGTLSVTTNKDTVLTATYKNDISELQGVKNITISYDWTYGGGSLIHEYDDTPPTQTVFTIKSSSTNGPIERKDEIIYVTISINGEEQIIELKV